MNVTIVGAGNMGLAMTAYLAVNHKAEVTLYTGKQINNIKLNIVDKELIAETDSFSVTNDPVSAFSNADIIFVTYPAFLRPDFIRKNQEYIKEGTFLGFVPGYGGAEYACTEMISRGVTVFGFQRVPYVARANYAENGIIAGILSSKKELFIGAIPSTQTKQISEIVEELLDIPVRQISEYLSITLAPSNPLLHITGLYNVFKDYQKGQTFKEPLKLYEEWNDSTSELLFQYDEEVQNICRNLSPLNMSEVVKLPVYYESPTPEAMTRKLKSIESFKAVMVPLKKTDGGYIPDLQSRMFVEDFPYGVCIFKDFANILGVDTPVIDLMLLFYTRLSGHEYFKADDTYTEEIFETGVPGIYGLHSKEKIISFYHDDMLNDKK